MNLLPQKIPPLLQSSLQYTLRYILPSTLHILEKNTKLTKLSKIFQQGYIENINVVI